MDIQQLYQIYQQHPVITTDSRDCPQGSIFFALKGESFDGNKFAASAIEKGCAYAVIDNAEYKKDYRFILVDNVLQTFKDLAREHRRQFNIPVIGITGTLSLEEEKDAKLLVNSLFTPDLSNPVIPENRAAQQRRAPVQQKKQPSKRAQWHFMDCTNVIAINIFCFVFMCILLCTFIIFMLESFWIIEILERKKHGKRKEI